MKIIQTVIVLDSVEREACVIVVDFREMIVAYPAPLTKVAQGKGKVASVQCAVHHCVQYADLVVMIWVMILEVQVVSLQMEALAVLV